MKKVFKKNKKGFTLIELIIVIAILAILAAVAIPSFVGLTNEANNGKAIGNATAIVTAINTYNALHPVDADKIAAIDAATIQGTLGTLWPQGIAAADVTTALGKITINNYIAVVDTAPVN